MGLGIVCLLIVTPLPKSYGYIILLQRNKSRQSIAYARSPWGTRVKAGVAGRMHCGTRYEKFAGMERHIGLLSHCKGCVRQEVHSCARGSAAAKPVCGVR